MSDQTVNTDLYKAPDAKVMSDYEGKEYDTSSMFKPAGRAGRVRYLKYSIGLSFLSMVIGGVVGGIMGATGEFDPAILVIIFNGFAILTLPLAIIFMIRRFHDIGGSGWWSLTMLIPLVNLIPALLLLFKPGSNGPNKYGPPPHPDFGRGAWVIVVFFLVFFLGILAAVAIPAYNDYIQAVNSAAGP